MALLRGVENARLGLKHGQLQIEASYWSQKTPTSQTIEVQFDGNRKRFKVVSGGKLARAIFDGTDLLVFDGESTIVQSPSRQTADYLFDPRVLGITAVYDPESTVTDCLRYEGARKVELVGSESIDGTKTWKVQVVDSYGQSHAFWVAEAEFFPVLKYEFTFNDTRRVCQSQYADSQVGSPIPESVEVKYYKDGEQTRSRRIWISNLDPDTVPDAELWTLAGLEMPVGTAVSDVRIKQRLGYWDGSTLKNAMVPPRATIELKESENKNSFWLYVNLFVVFCLLGVYAFRRAYARS